MKGQYSVAIEIYQENLKKYPNKG